jgi:threonine synthase
MAHLPHTGASPTTAPWVAEILSQVTRCRGCGDAQPSMAEVRCPRCGGVFRLCGLRWDPHRLRDGTGLDRYRDLLPLGPDPRTFNAGGTPLDTLDLEGREVQLQREDLEPTGSFKDRGMAVLMNAALATSPAPRVHVDSVGNTAAALAAFARDAGLEAHVFAPLATTGERVALLTGYGACVHLVAGPRVVSGEVALEAMERAQYLSHIYHPLFQAGTATLAFELFERGPLPDRIFLAVGQGTLLLGLHHGFRALLAAGAITRVPRLMAVRPQALGGSVAVGAASVRPVRAQEVQAAARASGGEVVWFDDEAIRDADRRLEAQGLELDPAAALAVAGWLALRDDDPHARDVIVACGARREPMSA